METPPPPFTRTEALTAGWTGRRLDAALRSAALTRVFAGVYAPTATWEELRPWERHLALARTASRATPDAIVSHASAAALLGLPMPPTPPQRATMTLLDDTRTSSADSWRQFHRGATPASHVWIRGRTPHLVPARTVIDCLRELASGDALAVVDGALRRGLVTVPALRRFREHERRWPGIAVADALLALADGRRETWLESFSAWAFHECGLPPGVPQVVVLDGAGCFVARTDVGWAGLGVVGEADGRGKYLADAPPGDPADVVAARRVIAQGVRESRIRDLGLEVVRWDALDAVSRPADLRTRWAAAVERARPGRFRGRLLCGCCRRDLTDCGYPTSTGPGWAA